MDNHLLVIFGASGDLAERKLIPALFNLFRRKLLPKHFAILGISRTVYSDNEFRKNLDPSLKDIPDSTAPEISQFLNMVYYLPVETSQREGFAKAAGKIKELDSALELGGNVIFYLATPPDVYKTLSINLGLEGLAKQSAGWKRIIVEKPFGSDLASARELNTCILEWFREEQIYRIDHYLGKETVQNVMVTRFSNGVFEPLWNRNFINHVEITSAESLGVENRGGYYENAGALRDMVQNHLLHLLTFVAMEPPSRITSNAIRNETLKVLQSVRPFTANTAKKNVIRGQYTASTIKEMIYPGYREEKGINPDSRTETYVALKLYIDNWRWGGVPFYIRTGKRLPTRVTEVVVHFRSTPNNLFCLDAGRCNSDNQLIIRIQPDEGILLKISMKVPGSGFNLQEINMDFHYSDLGQDIITEAYQRLLMDCMQGDQTLFTRGDAIEQSWELMEPVLKVWREHPGLPVYGYPAGTWGPQQADGLFGDPSYTWRYPCKNLEGDGLYCEL